MPFGNTSYGGTAYGTTAAGSGDFEREVVLTGLANETRTQIGVFDLNTSVDALIRRPD